MQPQVTFSVLVGLFTLSQYFNAVAAQTYQEKIDVIYKECLDRKSSCFATPATCIEHRNCDMFLSWSTRGGKHMFHLAGKKYPAPGGYISMAFSDDPTMGDDSVVACLHYDNGTVETARYKNVQQTSQRTSDPKQGLVPGAMGIETDHLYCDFEQKDHNMGEIDVKMSGEYYFFLAAGPFAATPPQLGKHTSSPQVSSRKFKVNQNVGDITKAMESGSASIAPSLFGTMMGIAGICYNFYF